ncbi:MAG TPA: hypothetical protein DCW31_01510 [Lactobacillus sp.]|nr:hypothetical protein [Lactobacillus sp.]
MNENETNKRHRRTAQIRHTQQDFVVALNQLLANKPLNKITVTNIVARAGYSRRTFYRHFLTLDDILIYQLNELTIELYELLSKQPSLPFKKVVLLFFEFWWPYRALLNQLRYNNRLYLLANSLTNNLSSSLLSKIKKPDTDYLQQFAIGGMFAMLTHWVQHGCTKSPKEMSKIAQEIQFHLTTNK